MNIFLLIWWILGISSRIYWRIKIEGELNVLDLITLPLFGLAGLLGWAFVGGAVSEQYFSKHPIEWKIIYRRKK